MYSSIMGESSDPGVIPQFSEELFERIDAKSDKDVSYLFCVVIR